VGAGRGNEHEWRAADRFRFANRLSAWIEVDDSGNITSFGYGKGGCLIGSSTVRRPYVQWNSPLVWTTLSLTMHADGRAEPALAGTPPSELTGMQRLA
jgi:hypothetical protein